VRAAPLFALLLCGCYLSHRSAFDAGVGVDAASCAPRPIVCVRAPDACSLHETVAAECDPVTLELRCPAGARERVAALTDPELCLPFSELDGIRRLAAAPVRVPTEEGCLWIFSEVELASGATIENAGVLVDPALPFGACPRAGRVRAEGLTNLVEVSSGTAAPIVQLTGSYRLGGETRVVFRDFVFDPGGGFGVRNVGSGIGRWDEARWRVIVPGVESLSWPPEIDLGDAVLGGAAHAFIYGCPGPPDFLTEDCILGRVGASGEAELWMGDRWSAEPGEASLVFQAGPWRSSVVRMRDGRYLHVFTVGFGTNLEAHVAPAPEGPWTSIGILAACDLPDDPGAYCAGAVIHEELADPFVPGTIAVSYSVGSTTPGWAELARETPRDYWPRLARVRVP
jgi:hypothetical protein